METLQKGPYRHYKGDTYVLQSIGRLESSKEEMAIYKGPDGTLWVRPAAEFFGTVSVNGEYVPRFLFLGEDDL